MFASSRFALRAVPLAALTVFALLVGSHSGQIAAQDPDAKPNFGSKKVKAGFTPDPIKIEVIAGGPLETNKGNVTAWVSKAPDFSLHYTAGALPLTFYATSKEDTTLLINLPDGTWVANDDFGGTLDPLIKFKAPESGRYDVWVGTIGKNKAPKATLHITELK